MGHEFAEEKIMFDKQHGKLFPHVGSHQNCEDEASL